MLDTVEKYKIFELLSGDHRVVYTIPRYQREYSWGKAQWESLYDDLLDNDLGYFLGSIICINSSGDAISPKLELVDGQQRMTSMSILLAAIYDKLKLHKDSFDDDQASDLNNLKHRLVLKRSQSIRLELQVQNNNLQDYRSVLANVGLLDNVEQIANAGNRRVFKAFRYFQKRVEQSCEGCHNILSVLFGLVERVNQAVLVKIEVKTHSDAYVLFESLNNRGTPLTAIDLIKNKLLAEVGKSDTSKVDLAYDQWAILLKYLTDDYSIQERFLRQFYNAYQHEFSTFTKVSFATKSNLIKVYEKLINKDVNSFLERVKNAGKMYSSLILPAEYDETPLNKSLIDLENVQGAPAYMLLLFLRLENKGLELDEAHLVLIVKILVKFFVRRNLTNTPPTRDLDRLFISVILKINTMNLTGIALVDSVRKQLVNVSVPIKEMEEALQGDLYLDNATVTRFLLCSMEESTMTREKLVDLWVRSSKDKYVWTIEHIFPQGENIPAHWIEMIAQGDKEKASRYRDKYVHQLGNLTISGYNSELGVKSFEQKRDRLDKEGREVGFRNGLDLNSDLASKDSWSIDDIEERTKKLTMKIIKLFAYKGESVS